MIYKIQKKFIKETLSKFDGENDKNLYVSLALANDVIDRYHFVKYKNTDKVSLRFDRGRIFYLLDMYQESINDNSIYLEYKPNSWSAYFNRGLSYFYYREYKKSINDLSYALKLNDNNSPGVVYNQLALSYYEIDDLRKSYSFFKKAVKQGYPVSESIGSSYWHLKIKYQMKKSTIISFTVVLVMLFICYLLFI